MGYSLLGLHGMQWLIYFYNATDITHWLMEAGNATRPLEEIGCVIYVCVCVLLPNCQA